MTVALVRLKINKIKSLRFRPLLQRLVCFKKIQMSLTHTKSPRPWWSSKHLLKIAEIIYQYHHVPQEDSISLMIEHPLLALSLPSILGIQWSKVWLEVVADLLSLLIDSSKIRIFQRQTVSHQDRTIQKGILRVMGVVSKSFF